MPACVPLGGVTGSSGIDQCMGPCQTEVLMEPSVPQLDVQEGASANLLPPSKLDVALHMHCLYLGAAGGGSPPSPGVCSMCVIHIPFPETWRGVESGHSLLCSMSSITRLATTTDASVTSLLLRGPIGRTCLQMPSRSHPGKD